MNFVGLLKIKVGSWVRGGAFSYLHWHMCWYSLDLLCQWMHSELHWAFHRLDVFLSWLDWFPHWGGNWWGWVVLQAGHLIISHISALWRLILFNVKHCNIIISIGIWLSICRDDFRPTSFLKLLQRPSEICLYQKGWRGFRMDINLRIGGCMSHNTQDRLLCLSWSWPSKMIEEALLHFCTAPGCLCVGQ